MDMIIGLGEIGEGIHQLLKNKRNVCGIDTRPYLTFGKLRNYAKYTSTKLDMMHICIPYTERFNNIIAIYAQEFPTKALTIHSTVKPGTTKILSGVLENLGTSVFYSPIRGVHSRMLSDIMRYKKFYATYQEDDTPFVECFKDACGLNIKKVDDPRALEIMKPLMDTTYYGWLIIFWQLVDKVCRKQHVSFDDMTAFTEEIQEFCGNRPKFYVDPKGIGGHCVLPNLELLEDILPEVILGCSHT
jgi:hypothetical protein